jgi:threonine synthase
VDVSYVSTRRGAPRVGFVEALFAGLAPDGGLYVPESIPHVDFEDLRDATLVEVGTAMAAPLIGGALSRPALERLLGEALNFPIPLALVGSHAAVELFHGPTFAFKDVGARVMARLMAALHRGDRELTILVATSGDTGGAVAQAFHGLSGFRVIVLFPERGVTPVQEAQFATLGGNVQALAVDGTFDDCQRLAKEAFATATLRERAALTSANSINLGRLLPQAFYYAHVALQSTRPVIFSVPSGNFGNVTAGLLAWQMGAPIQHFVAATTINDTVPRYLRTGQYEPRPSVPTRANAMDVGNPSNFERMRWVFADRVEAMRQMITGSVHTDDDVSRTIADVFAQYEYVCDPHTAVAYCGLVGWDQKDAATAFLATAHPAKFKESVEPAIKAHIPLPTPLAEAMRRPRYVERIDPRLEALEPFL